MNNIYLQHSTIMIILSGIFTSTTRAKNISITGGTTNSHD